MNLEGSSNKEDDSSTSTVSSGDEGIRRLESFMIASGTPGTLGDADENQLAPDEVWGQVWPAFVDLRSGGETKIPEYAARHFFGEHTPFKGARIHRTIQTKRTKSSLRSRGAKMAILAV